MEFGPRALGARSILADLRSDRMQDRINLIIKQRESFNLFYPCGLPYGNAGLPITRYRRCVGDLRLLKTAEGYGQCAFHSPKRRFEL